MKVRVTKAAAASRGIILEQPPVGELGAPANIGVVPWASMYLGDELEQSPDLQWPTSILTYTAMMNDSQIEGLLAGTTLPIRRYNWMIDPNGCDPAKVELLAADMNLPIKGEPSAVRRRTRDRFSHDRHLFHALRALAYGHYYMEVVAEVRDDGIAHLAKLAPRPPQTIQEVALERDGSLRFIKQNVSVPIQGGFGTPEIPANKVLPYVWDQEGANWFGRSMLRACYRNWLIKDRLLRVDAIKHERNGMGVPVAYGAPGYGRGELAALGRMAQSFKAGEASGGALPNGTSLELLGVKGSLPDTIASVQYHDTQMARRFMMMFMQLSESLHGNRALGEAFIDVFQLNQDTVAEWYRDTTTEYIIEDWWSWNVDPESDTTPFLTFERSDALRDAVGDLYQLIESGAIQVDDEIEDAVRQAYNLPLRTTPRATAPLPAPPTSPENPADPAPGGGGAEAPSGASKAKRQQRTAGAGGVLTSPALPLPSRPLRRQPNEHEVKAQMDLAHIDTTYEGALDKLFRDWQGQVTNAQIDHLTSAISKTANLETLASLEAPAIGKDLLEQAMHSMYAEGVQQALFEAKMQGVEITEPNPEDYTGNFGDRAAAIDEVNARMLGNMASTRAVRVSGGKLNREEVAAATRDYLSGLKFAMLRDRLGGALQAAMNTGRRAVFAEGPAADYYSSEILDVNTCGPCTDVDGTHYDSVSDSERDYPGGGFVNCAGGDRCRGTVVAVYKEGNNPSAGGEV